MTVPATATEPKTDRTLPYSLRLVTYTPKLLWQNVILWGLVHASPALLTLAVSTLFRHLEAADKLPRGLAQQPAILAAWVAVLGFAAVRTARIGVFYWGFRVWIDLWLTLDALVRRNLLAYLLTAGGSRRLPDTPAEAVSRFRDDVDDVGAYIEVWVDTLGFVVYSAIAIVLMSRIDLTITLLVCTPLLLIVYLMQRLSPVIRQYRRRMREATARVTDFIGETFGAISAVKLAAREDQMVAHLRALGEVRRERALKDVLLSELMRGINVNMVNLTVGVVLLLGAQRVRGGEMNVADFVLFIGLLPRLTGSMGFFGDAIARHRRTGVSYERMERLLQDAPAFTPVEHHPLYLHSDPPPLTTPQATEPLRELRVQHLTALHSSGQGVRDITFSVRRGEFVVITGRIGSGKSTLLRAIQGLLPRDSGQIFWNGQELTDPASSLVPPRSAYAAQLPNLFSDTLSENVLSGSPDHRLHDAVRLAVLEPDLAELGSGLETQVGARGVKLSGGQVQRTAVARMLARDAELLIFDDVSSALDARTEAALWEGLFSETDSTCLVVSHRRAALLRADRILLLQGGQLVAEGTLNELLNSNAEMQALWADENSEEVNS